GHIPSRRARARAPRRRNWPRGARGSEPGPTGPAEPRCLAHRVASGNPASSGAAPRLRGGDAPAGPGPGADPPPGGPRMPGRRQALLGRFRSTSLDRVRRLTLALIELAEQRGSVAIVEGVARELHTLKGEARML